MVRQFRLDGVGDCTPLLRTRIKAETQACRDTKSKVWRLRTSLQEMVATLHVLSTHLAAVRAAFHNVVGGNLSRSGMEGLEWLDAFAEVTAHVGSTIHGVVVSALEDVMVNIQEHTLKPYEELDTAEQELCAALQQYGRLAEGKATETACFEENANVYEKRKLWHQRAVHYCAGLNVFGIQKMTLVHSALAEFLQLMQQFTGHGMTREQLSSVLASIHDATAQTKADVAGLKKAQDVETRSILAQADVQYYLEIDPNNPFFDSEPQSGPLLSTAVAELFAGDGDVDVSGSNVRADDPGPVRSGRHSTVTAARLPEGMQALKQQQPASSTTFSGAPPCGWVLYKQPRGMSAKIVKKGHWAMGFLSVEAGYLIVVDPDNHLTDAFYLRKCYCVVDDADQRRHVFSVKPWQDKKRHYFQAPNKETRDFWVQLINELSQSLPELDESDPKPHARYERPRKRRGSFTSIVSSIGSTHSSGLDAKLKEGKYHHDASEHNDNGSARQPSSAALVPPPPPSSSSTSESAEEAPHATSPSRFGLRGKGAFLSNKIKQAGQLGRSKFRQRMASLRQRKGSQRSGDEPQSQRTMPRDAVGELDQPQFAPDSDSDAEGEANKARIRTDGTNDGPDGDDDDDEVAQQHGIVLASSDATRLAPGLVRDGEDKEARVLPSSSLGTCEDAAPVIKFRHHGSTDLRHEPLSSDESDVDQGEWATTQDGKPLLLLNRRRPLRGQQPVRSAPLPPQASEQSSGPYRPDGHEHSKSSSGLKDNGHVDHRHVADEDDEDDVGLDDIEGAEDEDAELLQADGSVDEIIHTAASRHNSMSDSSAVISLAQEEALLSQSDLSATALREQVGSPSVHAGSRAEDCELEPPQSQSRQHIQRHNPF